jgi:GT2 family glycosyltransferase
MAASVKIHIIVVAYALADDLLRLYRSADAPNVQWHVFVHSQFPEVVEAVQHMALQTNVQAYWHGVNRGLAKSWNEGLMFAQMVGADVMMIANDDAVAGPGDVQRLAETAMNNRDKYLIVGNGYDIRNGAHSHQALALAAINPIALETIGYFDENFFPIYWEDVDWYRRAALAGLQMYVEPCTSIIHMGSRSLNHVPPYQHHDTFHANRAYYARKWGGEAGSETYTIPFNDSAFGLCIEAAERKAPYLGYNRTDQHIVEV